MLSRTRFRVVYCSWWIKTALQRIDTLCSQSHSVWIRMGTWPISQSVRLCRCRYVCVYVSVKELKVPVGFVRVIVGAQQRRSEHFNSFSLFIFFSSFSWAEEEWSGRRGRRRSEWTNETKRKNFGLKSIFVCLAAPCQPFYPIVFFFGFRLGSLSHSFSLASCRIRKWIDE